MSISFRADPRAFRQLSQLSVRQFTRRFAHDHAHAHHSGPKSEGFGKSFYFTLALLPTGYILYALNAHSASGGGIIGRAVKVYGDLQETWVQRNALHTRMVEQAGHDRNLFGNTAMPNHIELRFPEVFSVGSPYNVPAGHYANMDKLVDHYRQKHLAEEEEKIKRLKAKAEAKTQLLSTGDVVKER